MKRCCLYCRWYEKEEKLCLFELLTNDGPMISVYLPERETSCSKYEEATTK